MKLDSICRGLVLVAALGASNVAAAPIDFTTGVTTGVKYVTNFGTDLQDGADITLPYTNYLAINSYSAQIVPTGSAEFSEAFAAIGGNRDLGFGSALSTGAGVLEVGAFNKLHRPDFWIAVSRYYTTIKNNTDQAIDFDFFFEIEPAHLAIQGIRDGDTAHARVGASIDYLLRTPDAGTYVDSGGQLFDYFVDIDFDDRITGSGHVSAVQFGNTQSLLELETTAFSGSVNLPTIPAFGELTYYYDMFALFHSVDFEVGGFAQIGDPTDLVGGTAGRLVQRTAGPTPVPEPATALLLCGAVAAIGALRRR
jgi:hypothetical protein